jgi:hypothetical protein
LRRESYGNYIGTAQELWATYLSDGSEDEKDAAAVRLSVAEARVGLVAENPKIKDAAMKLREVLTPEPSTYPKGLEGEQQQAQDYKEASEDFLDAARDETETIGE